MSYTLRNRRVAYDNISVGNATGRELFGDTTSRVELYGGGICTSTSTGDQWHTNIQSGVSTSEDGGPDNMPDGAGGTTDPTNENTGSSNCPGFVTNP